MVWSPGHKLKNGRYTIDEVLKRGRYSVTYAATSDQGNPIMIKAINDEASDPVEFNQIQERFRNEAFQLRGCRNRHIVRVEDSFSEDDIDCISMELIPGPTLDKRNPRKMSEVEAVRYVRQVGEALDVMHQQKLVHRDVTPSNVILRSHNGVNEAVLIDFGLVKDWEISRSMTMMANNITSFTAPELCDSDEKRGAYTDLYALGAVLFALVTGENPPNQMQRKPNEKLRFPGGVDPKIEAAIEKAMQLESGDRSASVAEWLEMLPLVPEPTFMPPVPEEPDVKRKKKIETWQLVFGGVVALGALLAGLQGVAAMLAYLNPPKPATPDLPVSAPATPKPK
jgi:eukaryotic-like serine/threonine-protein kinase